MIKPRKKVIDTLKQQIAEGVYRPGQRLPTLMELTELLGVSRGTVCNALEELIEQGIVTRRHGAGCFLSENANTVPILRRKIAFITPGQAQAHYMKILEGVEHEAYKAGYELTFFNHGNQPQKAKHIAAGINPGIYAGVILMPLVGVDRVAVNQELLNILDRNGCLYVTVDTPVLSGGIVRGNYIGSDSYNAVRRLTEGLIEQGYRLFGSIRVFEGVGSAAQRMAGLTDQLQVAGLPIRDEWHQEIEDVPVDEQGRSNIHRIMKQAERPEIIFCSYDRIAGNVLDELNKMKVHVPDDIAVCGFDGSERSELLHLTTVRQDFTAMGTRAMDTLLSFIEHPNQGMRQEFIPCQPIFRNSTNRVPKPAAVPKSRKETVKI